MDHTPVLLNEVLETFDYLKKEDGYFVDGTLGAGGHSRALARKFLISNIEFLIIGIDKDQSALELAKKNTEGDGLENKFIFVHNDFKNITHVLSERGIEKINGALIDLGVSSMQLDIADRGFTFQAPDAPLDMRMDQNQALTAAEIVNTWNRQSIEHILKVYGEEHLAAKIATLITSLRKDKKIRTVGDLLQILERAIPARIRFSKDKHYATNTFRALRIAVNEELSGIDTAINDFVSALDAGARLAVISFHSSEDRIVKNTFRTLENPCICPPQLPECVCGLKPSVKVLTKKPIIPTEDEIRQNPRSRSAKLRVLEKL